MAEVMDRADTAVRLEVTAKSTLVTGAPVIITGFDESYALLSIVSRALFFEAAFDIFGRVFDYRSEVDVQKLIATVSSDQLATNPLKALIEQQRILNALGVEISSRGQFTLSIDRYSLTGTIGVELIELGSAHGSTKFTANIAHAFDVSKNVIAGLLVVALTSQPIGGTITVSGESETIFVCSINATVSGQMDRVIDDAISDLVFLGPPDRVPASVWKARQLCLYRLGFDPGKIDGIYGRKTKSAEKAFSEAFGGINVNWSSKVFARFVLENSNSKYQKELSLSEHAEVRKRRR